MAKLEFKDITVKNFLSFGNVETTLDYKSGLNLVTGKTEGSNSRNGSGKSCFFSDAISFVLYGKVMRGAKVTKDLIVNKFNKKDCVVKLNLVIDGEPYKVIRSIKPTELKVYFGESQEEMKFDSMAHTQEWLEKKLGVSHLCFNNIMILNVASSVPYLDMDSAKKREVIENVLQLNSYSKMSEMAKKIYLDLKTNIKVYDSEYKSALRELEVIKENQTKLLSEQSDFESRKKVAISRIKNQIESTAKELEETKCKISEKDYNEKLNEFQVTRDKLITDSNNCQNKINLSKSDLDNSNAAIKRLAEKPFCPTCHTPTDNPLIVDFLNSLKEKVTKSTAIIDEQSKLKESNRVKIVKIEENISKAKTIINDQIRIKQRIGILTSQLQSLNKEFDTEHKREFSVKISSNENISVLEDQVKRKEKTLDTANTDFKHYEVIRNILGEEGLRKFVVSKILPLFNTKLNEYLKILGSEYTVAFNLNLEEKIMNCIKEERPYSSFSSGEKKRIDLSILLSLMDISRLQNSVDTNILVLDEVLDTSMCSDGVENFLEHLKEGFQKAYPDKCVYVISHRKEISNDVFNRKISIIKRKGFSEIESITEFTQ
jgi:DNA repair exonuclease SbcCD ATPase subunit